MQTLKRTEAVQVTLNIPDDFVSDFQNIQSQGGEPSDLEKAFGLFLFQLKNTGRLDNIGEAYEELKQSDSVGYEYTAEDLAGIDEGIRQAGKDEHVPDDEMKAFFNDWRSRFKAMA